MYMYKLSSGQQIIGSDIQLSSDYQIQFFKLKSHHFVADAAVKVLTSHLHKTQQAPNITSELICNNLNNST